MKALLLSVAIVAVLAFAGYIGFSLANMKAIPIVNGEVGLPESTITEAIEFVKPMTQWGIGLPKVEINNYVPGTKVNAPLVLHNGEGDVGSFTLRYSDTSQPSFNKGWVFISRGSITLSPMETGVIPVSVIVPQGASLPKSTEFRILVEKAQRGTITTAYEQRWIIRTR